MTSPTPQSPRLNSLVQTLAEAYLERGEFAEAAEKFSELVRNGLQTPNVYRNLALSLLGMESLSSAAQQVYQYVLKNFPNDRELCLQICALLLKQRAHDAFALKCFQQALALNPPPPRSVQWALALHLEEIGYAPAAFEILKRMAMRENGVETQTLTQLMQLAPRLDKQNEARSILLYLEGRNERAQGVARFLALDYARAFFKQSGAQPLSTREWQTITQAALGYERLENLQAARECALLRLTLARFQNRNAQRFAANGAQAGEAQFNDFVQRLQPAERREKNTRATFPRLYAMRLSNLARIRAEAGENVARNLAQKFLDFSAKHLSKVARAECYLFSDGLLASAEVLLPLTQTAITLLQKIERYNLTAVKGAQLFAQTVIHAYSPSATEIGEAKLGLIYETLTLLEAKSEDEHTRAAQHSRLWLPRAIQEQEPAATLPPLRTPQVVRCAEEEYHTEICEAVWRNPLEHVDEKTPYDLKRFVVHAKLRQSHFAGTYRGRDRQLERNVIIKALEPAPSLQLAQNDEQREHVLAAIRGIAKLEAPGIATIYDMGFHEEIFSYAREYLEGRPLNVARQFAFAESARMAMRLCRILSVAHRQGVVHGNLKPENIWLFANDEIKLCDFYVPGFVATPEFALHSSASSWYFAAPEFLHTFIPSIAGDIYALGVLLLELVSDAKPFAAIKSVQEWQEFELPSLDEFLPEAPPGFPELIARACAKQPDQRFPNLLALENALRLFA